MKRRVKSRMLGFWMVCLLSLLLLIWPWSPSTQPDGFSLTLDLDPSEGDQTISSLDVSPDRVVPVQIYGEDIQNANSIFIRLTYDVTQVVYERFEPGDALPNVHTQVEQDSSFLRIGVSSLAGSATVNGGLIGTMRFRTTSAFSDTEIWLVQAVLSRGGGSEATSSAPGVVLQVAALPSPDFDANGLVGFSDFVAFAGGFGSRQGDEAFDARNDLNGDGGIGFDDFVIFARSFGATVNRAPVFGATPPVTRSVAENTPASQPIGDPISATDADGDSLTYGLRGVHADSFAIVTGTGQLLTKEGVAYDHETKDAYSVTVRVVDGQGGRATVAVGVSVTDVDEPPGARPAGVVVAPRDTALAVTWNAAADEAGKPPVSGYDVAYRQGDSGDWGEGRVLESRTDTSLTITGLTNDVTYEVRVRTLNDEGASPWSEPVIGVPTRGPEVVGEIREKNLLAGGDTAPLNVAEAFTRPGVGVLTYGAESSDEAIATVTVTDSIATVRPVGAGRTTITVTASDAYGNTARTTFAVVVASSPPPPPPPPPPTVGPTVSTIAFTSTPLPGQNGAYKRGDAIDVTVIFSEGVTVRDTPQVGLTVGAARRQANYKRGSSTTALLFQYTVQAADEDTDGASINANGLTRNNGSIKKNNATTSAHLAHGPVANQSAHKVDGVVPTLAHAEVTGDELNLSYGEVLDDDPKPAPGDFAVTVDGTARSVAVVGVNGSAVTLTLASAATSGQGVKLTYTPGTDPIRDRAQNPADALTNRTVSNLAQGNKRPVFNDGSSATRLVAENTAAGQDIQQPVSATDEDGHDLTYRLGGDDAADFAIDEFTGQLRTRSGVSYDYEAKSGYSLTVTVDDGHGGTSTIAVGIQVVDVNEPPSAPPSMLLLSAGNGQISISWSASPNEIGKPPVSGYELQRRLGEKGKWEHAYSFDRRDDTDILLVNVTNDVIHYFQVRTLNDEGESGWSKPVSGTLTAGPQVASAIPKQTLVLGGADVDVDLAQAFTHPSRFPMTYDAESSNDDVATVTVSDSIATLSPVRVGYETITATASDERDNEARSTFTITVAGQPPEPPPPPPPGNKLPVFNDGTTTTRMFAENPAEGQDIGDPVNATDEDGHGLTYRLGGDDAANFGIDSGTGQLRTLSGVTYDHETKSGFTVIITTDDGNGGIAAIGVTIFVVDVDESPDRPLAPILSVSDDSRRLSVRPNPSLPVNTGPDITGWEIQIAAKGSGDFYGYSPFPEPDWIQPNWNVVIPDLIPTWVYEVQLRARSDEGPSEWSPSAEATIPNERPVAKRGIRNVTLTAGAAALAISLEKVFSDPDGFTLTASSNNEPVATAEKYGSSVLIHPIATGTATITVTATDPWGLSGTRSFNVEIEAPVLQAHTLSIADSVFTFGFTDAFNASETRAYDVRIRHKTPIGPWATRCISVTNPDNIAQDVTTSRQIVASDFFEPGTTYEADFVHRGAGCDDVPSGLYSPKTEATTAGTPSFDIHVVYPEGALPLSYTRSIEEAVARWERIITDGIPNYRRSDANIRRFESGYPGLDVPEVVDDLMIFMDLNPYIANVAAVYGLFKRPSVSLLPWYCSISLNPSFMDESSHEGKTTTIGHEIGHCLGFHDSVWESHKLLMHSGRAPRIVTRPDPDTHFQGARAIAAFNAAGGSGYTGFKVPVENHRFGSVDSHWRNSVFGAELMSVYGGNAWSAITIQTMADIGYQVELSQADAFTLPSALSKPTSAGLTVTSPDAQEGLTPLNCVVTQTTDVVEPAPFVLKVIDNPDGE